jgi:hypothetical protein
VKEIEASTEYPLLMFRFDPEPLAGVYGPKAPLQFFGNILHVLSPRTLHGYPNKTRPSAFLELPQVTRFLPGD